MKLNATHSVAPSRDLVRLAANLEHAGCDGFNFADLSHDALLAASVAAQAE